MVERGVLTGEKAHELAPRGRGAEGEPGRWRWSARRSSGWSSRPLALILPAAILLAGCVWVMERRTTFPAMLGVVAYGSLPAAVREIVRAPLQLAKGSLDVYFSLRS